MSTASERIKFPARHADTLLLLQLLGLVLGFLLIVIVPITAFSMGLENATILGVGLGAFLILLLPVFFRKDFDLFEPISFVMLNTVIGVTLECVYMVSFRDDQVIELMRGKPENFLFSGGILILLGLIVFVMGYMMDAFNLPVGRIRFLQKEEWSTPRLLFVFACFFSVALVGAYLYIKKMGISVIVLSNISSKHEYMVQGAEFATASLGYYRWAASLLIPSFYLLLTWFAASKRRAISLTGAFVAVVGVLATLFPLLNSSRTGVVSVMIIGLVIWHYMRKEIRVKTILWTMTIVLVVLLIMGALRRGANSVEDIVANMGIEKILDATAGSMNFFAIAKTAHIYDAVPNQLDYQYGQTLVMWLLAPIPRTMWPGKPPIFAGALVGQDIYGTMDSRGVGAAIPPGYVAELYMNYGVPAVLIGMFMLGYCLRMLYRSLQPHLATNKNILVLYVPFMFAFSFSLTGNSVNQAIIESLTVLIPIGLALAFVRKQPRKQRANRICQESA